MRHNSRRAAFIRSQPKKKPIPQNPDFETGDVLTSKFDQRQHQITKVFKSKIYYSENSDGTGEIHSATYPVIIECFDFLIKPKQFIKLPPEKKPLFLIMQKVWFDEILSGRKDIEYREDTPFYRSRLIAKDGNFRNYETLLMQVGYNADAQRMTVEVKNIILDDCFEIHLGEIIEKNF